MNATKTKSGKWCCRVYVGRDENGNPIQKRIYADTKKDAELKASQYSIENPKENGMTVKDGILAYIKLREPVLSPSTILNYTKMANRFDVIAHKKINSLNDIDLQHFVNYLSEAGLSPKSVKNIFGLLSATLNQFRPNFHPKITLPKLNKNIVILPNDSDIRALIDNASDVRLKRAIMLSAYCSLRRSEIIALKSEDIVNNCIVIRSATVYNKANALVTKGTKTYSGTRMVEMPKPLVEELKNVNGAVCDLTPSALTNQFDRLCKKLGLSCRFHDLRHYYASTLHSLSIPDQYVMERGGWSNASTLKGIYQHPMREMEKEINQKIADKFNNI